MDASLTRRGFLLRTAGAAALLGGWSPPARAQSRGPWFFLTEEEAAFLHAVMDRLIPGDELSPSAAELGGVVFLDRQLATDWGAGAGWYLEGPWEAGTPQQGYQLQYTPAELYRRAIAAFQARLVEETGSRFEELPPEEQDRLLTNLERGETTGGEGLAGEGGGGSLGAGTSGGTSDGGSEGDDVQHATVAFAATGGAGEVDLDGVPGEVFFERMLTDAKWSYLGDPAYGGNREMAAWRMLGFPGAHAYYNSTVDNWSMLYDRPPSGIATGMDPYGVEGAARFSFVAPRDRGPDLPGLTPTGLLEGR